MMNIASSPTNKEGELYDVIIVGSGVAGASAAYHMSQQLGTATGEAKILVVDAGPQAGEGLAPRRSGSATMAGAGCIKMMVQIYAGSTDDFVHHHGAQGARRYLEATRQGLVWQKQIAKHIWKDEYSRHLKEMGSFYVTYEAKEDELRREFETLQSLGCDDIEWWAKDQLRSVPGMSSDFYCGIFFPKDAVIDSSQYAKDLLGTLVKDGKVRLQTNTTVRRIGSDDAMAWIELDASTKRIRGQHVIVATGGLDSIPQLHGLIKPCYSYLVHVPIATREIDSSANFFTWGFSHDWCFTNGQVRISGEDHFSAYKSPQCEERCERLARWTWETYQCDASQNTANLPQQYGVYSETPDMVPLIGPLSEKSRVCYLLGCNAWGQTILSCCSSLVPGFLGYRDFTEGETDLLELLSIRRFSHLPT